jgi:solute carrier family 38 (sodium-coupled neutral amino acid transporter), member 9
MEIEIKPVTQSNTPFQPSEFDDQLKNLMRKLSSSSFSKEEKTNSSLMTIFAVTNSMIGTLVMVLPILFLQYGIITSTLVLILIGWGSYKTSSLFVIHLKENEPDIPVVIKRLAGDKWLSIYVFSSVIYMVFCGIIYFNLMSNLIYSAILFVFNQCDFKDFAEKQENRYDVFSYPILGLILFLPAFISCFLKDINFIVKCSKIGVFALISYIIFLGYVAYDNFKSGNLSNNFGTLNLYTFELDKLLGNFCLGFFIHSNVCSLMKNNENFENNVRDLGLSYIFGGFLYFLIGFLGCLAVLGKYLLCKK